MPLSQMRYFPEVKKRMNLNKLKTMSLSELVKGRQPQQLLLLESETKGILYNSFIIVQG